MTQQEVIDTLELYPKEWFTANDISEILGTNISSITTNLKKLRFIGFVQWRFRDNKRWFYEYKHKSKK